MSTILPFYLSFNYQSLWKWAPPTLPDSNDPESDSPMPSQGLLLNILKPSLLPSTISEKIVLLKYLFKLKWNPNAKTARK